MKILKNNRIVLILLIILTCSTSVKVYGQTSESCELIFYRPAQSLMSGGAGIEIKIFINEQEIGMLPNGTVLNYTVFSQGPLKIKFVCLQMGTIVGSPKVINIEAKHGETTAIEVLFKFPKGAEAEILNDKKHEKIKKTKWEDMVTAKENIENPLIETK